MSSKFDLDSFIAIVLINKNKMFRDSYSLSKVLAWKFDIINVVDVTNSLEQVGLIKREVKNLVSMFELTAEGVKFIEDNIDEGRELMYKKYGNERVFLESLFNG